MFGRNRRTMATGGGGMPPIGTFWEGGYFAGVINVDGVHKAVILAPKEYRKYGYTVFNIHHFSASFSGFSTYDCKKNMDIARAINSSIATLPAFTYCYGLSINGFSDWLLPSIDVVELMYRNLKSSVRTNATSGGNPPHGYQGVNPNSIPIGDRYTSNNPSETISSYFKLGGSEVISHESNPGQQVMSSTLSGSLVTGFGGFYQAMASGLQSIKTASGTARDDSISGEVIPVRLVTI